MPSLRLFSSNTVGTDEPVNSFGVIQPDFGTSPTATQPDDTLTLTSDGSVTITGNSLTNTITLSVDGTDIGGFTQGSVIFANASGKLDQDNSNFFWDNTNNRLGIGTASPSTQLHLVPGGTTVAGILIAAPSSYNTEGFDYTVNGVRKWALDKDGYVTNATNIFRFKRNDSTTAYAAIDASGPNGLGAVVLSGSPVLSRSTLSVDFGDFDAILNCNFRGAVVNFLNDSQSMNLGNVSMLRWNGFGTAISRNFWIGHDDFPGNTSRCAIINDSSTKKGLVVQGAASQSATLQEWQNSSTTILASVNASGEFSAPKYTVNSSSGQIDLSTISAGTPNLKITATSDTPSTVWTAGVPDNDPAGYMEILVGSDTRYIPFWT